ncbi:hypothetical protein MMC09_004942 [Bachmanniomyces sp. S44760]|nr:hypothetical protein [Bachmanniomyces sp. S44760]
MKTPVFRAVGILPHCSSALPVTSNSPSDLPPAYTPTQQSALVIATLDRSLSSGFPYHRSLLEHYGITPAAWADFTTELQAVARVSRGQKFLAVASGVGAGLVSHGFAGMPVGRYVLRKSEMKNARQGADLGRSAEEERLLEHGIKECKESVSDVLRRWNALWSEKGVCVDMEIMAKGLTSSEMRAEEEGAMSGDRKTVVVSRTPRVRERKDRRFFRVVVRKVEGSTLNEEISAENKKDEIVVYEDEM